MNKELEAIKALGYEHKILPTVFKDQVPSHKFTKTTNERFSVSVFIEYRTISEVWTIRAVLFDSATDELMGAAITGDETEAFLAFLRAIEKGELDE